MVDKFNVLLSENMVYLLLFLILFSSAKDETYGILHKDIMNIVTDEVYYESLKDLHLATNITECYKAMVPFNNLVKINKAIYTSNKYSLRALNACARFKIDDFNVQREKLFSKRHSSHLEWFLSNPFCQPSEDVSWYTFTPLNAQQREIVFQQRIDINQPVKNVNVTHYIDMRPGYYALTNILPLQIVCTTGEIADIRFFIRDCGANPNAVDSKGQTALIHLCSNKEIGYYQGLEKQLAIAQELIKFGCDPNMQDKTGTTALMYAIKTDYYVQCDKWTDSGNPFCTIPGVRPHQMLNLPLIEYLIDVSDVNIIDNDGNSALLLASHTCLNPYIIQKLLCRNAQVTIKNKLDESPLHWAYYWKKVLKKSINQEIINSLISNLPPRRLKRHTLCKDTMLYNLLYGHYSALKNIVAGPYKLFFAGHE